MNQQMNLLEARAVAREREHQLQLGPRSAPSRRRSSRGRLPLSSWGRHRPRATARRWTGILVARG